MYEYQNWMTTKEKSYLLFTISKLELQTKLDTIFLLWAVKSNTHQSMVS